ncbi:hypothetical protein I547_7174 [Mycobacterium kansasii 824]|uniref:Uncharacterized protein n=1 Tax=Mycobacterium kansasii TaxID=1768 RepID=A0A1V3WBR8_MYCKA|nr:hypothetical protein I547_7174 [Mycobacterium kansasii 824]OOK64322.1 hypothetical protein BZL29_8265 [Mycobacterium kansasii]
MPVPRALWVRQCLALSRISLLWPVAGIALLAAGPDYPAKPKNRTADTSSGIVGWRVNKKSSRRGHV